MLPAIVLIVMVNIRTKQFCRACNTWASAKVLVVPHRNCPRCGAPLG